MSDRGQHARQPRAAHAGQPEPRPLEIYLAVAVTLLIYAAVAAYLLAR